MYFQYYIRNPPTPTITAYQNFEVATSQGLSDQWCRMISLILLPVRDIITAPAYRAKSRLGLACQHMDMRSLSMEPPMDNPLPCEGSAVIGGTQTVTNTAPEDDHPERFSSQLYCIGFC